MMLADDAAVRAVLLEGDVMRSVERDAVVVDMSTVGVDTTRALVAARTADKFVAAPVLAAPTAIAAGEGTLLLGGVDATLDKLQPLWSDLTSAQVRCGKPVDAVVVKLMANVLVIVGTAALAEAIVVGEAHGFDPDRILALLGDLPAVSPMAKRRLEDLVAGNHLPSLFDVPLAAKDLRLAGEIAQHGGATLPLSAATQAALQDIAANGYASHRHGRGYRGHASGKGRRAQLASCCAAGACNSSGDRRLTASAVRASVSPGGPAGLRQPRSHAHTPTAQLVARCGDPRRQ